MKVLKPITIPFPNNGQFIRGSTATYIEDGLLKTAAINEPRWQNGSLLMEDESTNICKQSQDLSLSPWGGAAPASSAVETWNGIPFQSLTKINAVANENRTQSLQVIQAGDTVTVTFAVLAGTVDQLNAGLFGGSPIWGNLSEAFCEILEGPGYLTFPHALAFIDNLSTTIPTLVRITRKYLVTTSAAMFFYPGGSGSVTIGHSVKVTRVQVEIKDGYSSYIPTTTANVTRAPDVCVGNFSRASTATFIDSAGVIQTAGVDVPRVQNGKLLLENAAVNVLRYSADFTNAVWVKNGSATASTFQTLNFPVVNQPITQSIAGVTPIGSTFTFSVDLYGTPGETVTIGCARSTGGVYEATLFSVNLTGAYTRYTVSHTIVNPDQLGVQGFISRATDDTASLVYARNAQLETGLISTSYIPTTVSSVARAADFHSAGLVYTNAVDATPVYSSGTTYVSGEIVKYNNKRYESLQPANLNKQPDLNPTWWLDLGADNISAAFDNKVGSKTNTTGNLRMIIYPGTTVDAVGYLETNALVVNTSVTDANREKVYFNSTGISEDTIENWYDYFFVSTLSSVATQVVHQGIPSLDPNLFIGIELVNPTGTEIGSLLTGYSTTLGKTQYGVKAGIVDYSKKTADDFGNVSIVERPYSKRMSADVYVPNYDLNKVQRFLYNIRATPVLWMASDNPELAEVSYVYGFYKDFSSTISYPDVSMCNLEIEGLI